MKERGIIFSAPMVLAILGGQKTQTRRVARHMDGELCRCPYGGAGDRLWVREVWAPVERAEDHVDGIRYRADESFSPIENTREAADRWVEAARNDHTGRWRPPIFMPRWASRIVLEVVEVRCQRLHAITADDAIAEGMRLHHDGRWWRGAPHKVTGFPRCMPTARDAYADLWDTMHAKRNPWGSNPWVWAVTFRRLQP